MGIGDFDKWIIINGFYTAQVMLIIAAALMVIKKRGAIELLCLIGFICFFAGSLIMQETSNEILRIGDVRIGSNTNRDLWSFGRLLSSIGFLVGAGTLMLKNLVKS